MQVGTFIIQKMLLDNAGLAYVCGTAEQFFTVARVFDMMLSSLKNQHSSRLLKLIIRCYSRLSEHSWLVDKFHNLKYSLI